MYIETNCKPINEQSKKELFDTLSNLSCSLVISDNPMHNARFYNWCISQNFVFIGQIVSLNEWQFARYHGIGKLMHEKVKTALEKQGLCFKDKMSDKAVENTKKWAKTHCDKALLKSTLVNTTQHINQQRPCRKQKDFIQSLELACNAAFSSSFLDLTIKQLRLI